METKEKIYCSNCSYYRSGRNKYGIPIPNLCYAPQNAKDTWLMKDGDFADSPEKINESNCCSYFKQKRKRS